MNLVDSGVLLRRTCSVRHTNELAYPYDMHIYCSLHTIRHTYLFVIDASLTSHAVYFPV